MATAGFATTTTTVATSTTAATTITTTTTTTNITAAAIANTMLDEFKFRETNLQTLEVSFVANECSQCIHYYPSLDISSISSELFHPCSALYSA